MDLLKVAEIERRYPDEWVLVEIVRDHRDHRKITGRLLAHSPDRDDLDEPYRRFRAEHPTNRTLEYFTGELIKNEEGFSIVL